MPELLDPEPEVDVESKPERNEPVESETERVFAVGDCVVEGATCPAKTAGEDAYGIGGLYDDAAEKMYGLSENTTLTEAQARDAWLTALQQTESSRAHGSYRNRMVRVARELDWL